MAFWKVKLIVIMAIVVGCFTLFIEPAETQYTSVWAGQSFAKVNLGVGLTPLSEAYTKDRYVALLPQAKSQLRLLL